VNEFSERSENPFFVIDVKAAQLVPLGVLKSYSPRRQNASGSERTA